MKDKKIVSFGIFIESPVMYEADYKSLLLRLLRRYKNWVNNRYNTTDLCFKYEFPAEMSEQDIKDLLSYLLKEHLQEQKKKKLNARSKLDNDIVFLLKSHDELKKLGIKSIGTDKADAEAYYCYSNAKSEENREFKNNFKSWYNSKVDKSNYEEIANHLLSVKSNDKTI